MSAPAISVNLKTPTGPITPASATAPSSASKAPQRPKNGGSSTKSPPKSSAAGDSATKAPTAKKKSDNPPARKKKEKTQGSNTAPARVAPTTLNAATAAAMRAEAELLAQRAEAEARKNDAAWLSPELLSVALQKRQAMGSDSGPLGFLAEETHIVDRALHANGLLRTDVTPQAYGSLLEYARKYAHELVSDAQEYAWHSSRTDIEARDLKLAVDLREDASVASSLPPRHQVMALAEELNRIPLPPIPSHCYNGIVLPPGEHQLTARTFDVVMSTITARQQTLSPVSVQSKEGAMQQSESAENGAATANKSAAATASYGANKSKKIPVTLQSQQKAQSAQKQPSTAGSAPSQPQPTTATPAAATSQPSVTSVLPAAPAVSTDLLSGELEQELALSPMSIEGGGGSLKRKSDEMSDS